MTELMTGALYLILFVLVKLKVFKNWAKWMTITPLVFFAVANLIFVVPMNWVAPKGPMVVYRNTVEITPMVSGEVIEVSVRGGQQVKKGDTLFKILEAPYQAAVDDLNAQLSLAKTRQEQSSELAARKVGSLADVQQFESQVRSLEAQLSAAQLRLTQTTVRAPTDGVIPDVALQVGALVSTSKSVMPFVDESQQFLAVQIPQGNLRNVEPGLEADFVLKLYPGKVFKAVVDQIIPINPSGQLPPSGLTAATPDLKPGPYWVILNAVDEQLRIPAGAMGTGTIFTGPANMTHVFRQIMLRSETWRNYLIP